MSDDQTAPLTTPSPPTETFFEEAYRSSDDTGENGDLSPAVSLPFGERKGQTDGEGRNVYGDLAKERTASESAHDVLAMPYPGRSAFTADGNWPGIHDGPPTIDPSLLEETWETLLQRRIAAIRSATSRKAVISLYPGDQNLIKDCIRQHWDNTLVLIETLNARDNLSAEERIWILGDALNTRRLRLARTVTEEATKMFMEETSSAEPSKEKIMAIKLPAPIPRALSRQA
ncbi:uncharacterized protein MKK02DRAFT_40130 [Dioszegia hungarica]|uniref:Uncharacterized protein n=1 Tax=Dioszegia hungarica TaxID=4972 RepID=A0AA38HI32_9TREE|nr:uncharacterized protein MKK02DRAFT_40130 [Dioszegia hungarica]KAI9639804.1 hypothetical protein MKK02DRAFT_40130 [Dioszegia hungarica]